MKAFKEIKTHEYRLMALYKPDKVKGTLSDFYEEIMQKEKESKVEIDPSRMSKGKT